MHPAPLQGQRCSSYVAVPRTHLGDNLWQLEQREAQDVEEAECCEGLGGTEGPPHQQQVGEEGRHWDECGDGVDQQTHQGLHTNHTHTQHHQ